MALSDLRFAAKRDRSTRRQCDTEQRVIVAQWSATESNNLPAGSFEPPGSQMVGSDLPTPPRLAGDCAVISADAT